MTTYDTIDALKIREPLPIASFGSVFWSQSYVSRKGQIEDYPDFKAFLSQPWIVHYSIPSYGGFTLDIKLATPLRTDEGFENVDIDVDYLMGTIERSYTRDWNQQVKIEDLSIPLSLIKSLEKLLLEWGGERLMVHYCLLPGEGDPLAILVEFGDCDTLPDYPDDTLRYIARQLTETFVS